MREESQELKWSVGHGCAVSGPVPDLRPTDEAKPPSKAIEILASIWQQVLEISSVRVDDNFFDIGGNASRANLLFQEIARRFRKELSPLTIYEAPTIMRLASILESPDLPHFSPVVSLRPGRQNAAVILLIPGFGTSWMHLFDLAKNLDSSFPIYGLQPPGMDGIAEPFETIEDLARYYLDALRVLPQPTSYILIGHSNGGLVALEIAQHLRGSTVLLALVESYPHSWHLFAGRFAKLRLRQAARRITARFRQRVTVNPRGFELEPNPTEGVWTSHRFVPIMRRASRAEYRSWRKYRPRRYRGTIHLVRNTHPNERQWIDARSAWAELADKLVLDTPPEPSAGISRQRSNGLAVLLSKYLKESLQPLITITIDDPVRAALP